MEPGSPELFEYRNRLNKGRSPPSYNTSASVIEKLAVGVNASAASAPAGGSGKLPAISKELVGGVPIRFEKITSAWSASGASAPANSSTFHRLHKKLRSIMALIILQ